MHMARQHLLAHRLRAAALALLSVFAVSPSRAAGPVIGLAAPLTGFAAPLGNQMQAGAAAAAGTGALLVEDTACTAEGGARAAAAFVAAKVALVTGFLCTEALEAALPVLTAANIAVITAGVRTDALTDMRDRTGHLVWRLAPRLSAEAQGAAALLLPRCRDHLFAIIDDGTIHGRELAGQFRLAAEEAGLKPVFTDTFRPQLSSQTALAGRLRKAGATHVFVGGDRADVAILARDAAALGLELEIAGGEALQAAGEDVPLAPGVLAVLPREPMLPPAAAEAFAKAGITVEGHVAPAFEAVLLASQVLEEEVPADAVTWHERLDGQAFALPGTFVRFDAKGDLADNPFVLKRWTGEMYEDVN